MRCCFPAGCVTLTDLANNFLEPEVKLKVLFLCADNGVQSLMAEALLRRLDSEHFDVSSAGTEAGVVHPLTVEVMKDIGIDLKGTVTKALHEVAGPAFDFVITLCARSRSVGDQFTEGDHVHWQLDDPLTVDDPAKQTRMFRSLRDQIAQRVRLFSLVQVRFSRVEMESRLRGDLVHS
jgi:protein-tyrosine-phosphatase